jgi:hypothetical protein
MIKLKRIRKESDIVVGGLYLETLQNRRSENNLINFLRWRITGKPMDYPGKCESSKNTRWVKANLVCFDDYVCESDITSLSDMGVTDNPYNDHKLYRIMKGTSMEELESMTYAQVEELAE